tara:strand:- start:492 stop:653 length:162 start_codon:yes stop_codon:yes gene_type:complete
LDVKDFDTKEVLWEKFGKLIRVVRQSVLVGELDLPESFVSESSLIALLLVISS